MYFFRAYSWWVEVDICFNIEYSMFNIVNILFQAYSWWVEADILQAAEGPAVVIFNIMW